MEIVLKTLLFTLLAAGSAVVFMADRIEKKFNMGKKESIKHSEEYDEKTLEDLKTQKAVIRVKLFGLVVLLPVIIIILIVFK